MLLTPYRVLDLTGPLGFLTGRILADLGADVIKVEPPGGDPSRGWPPFATDAGGRESLTWMAYNANKRGITLDLDTPSGQFVLRELAHRTAAGAGEWVDGSAQSAVMAALAHAPVFWDLNGINPERAGIYITGRSMTGARMRAFWPCKDGWINFIVYGGAAGRHTN